MQGPIFDLLSDKHGVKNLLGSNTPDVAYLTASLYNYDATEDAVTEAEEYYAADHTGDSFHEMFYNTITLGDQTYEERLADELHIQLIQIAIKSFVSRYSRVEMVQMLNLLNKGSLYYPDDIRVRIGRADTLQLWNIAFEWNETHEDEKPIHYSSDWEDGYSTFY